MRTCEELLAVIQYGQQSLHTTTSPTKADSQAQRNVPIPVCVVLLEHIRHALETYASLHEEVERQHPLSLVLVPLPLDLDFANVPNSSCTNCGLNLYPNATSASSNSRNDMLPERSTSKRSNSPRHAARNPQRPQNSSKLIDPLRSVSNIRIIMRTVWGSNAV